ncbi:anti-sigma factor [Uliginosibacterium sp. H1]|uniref:anti-sigma factor n=1 Tax=Uliginosibacterium sp. H1 TaxID=3114757 RepID=UPI002E193018|nr:anti-sigma factor [Uliginosibacterium sp. H1]
MTPQNPPRDDMHHDGSPDELLAGEYVLGTLSAEARAQVEARLAHDVPLRAAVDAWEARLLPLTALAPADEPSADLWPRIARSLHIAGARAAGPAAKPAARADGWQRWWNSLALWRGLATGAVAVALLLAVALGFRLGAPAGPQYMVVLVAPQDKAPGWVIQASSPRELSLIPLGMTPVPAARSLQFWTKADDWSGPVSLGLVQPGEPMRVPIDRLPPLQHNQLFELTLEPENGSPIGRPTGPILYIGRAVRVRG